MSGNTRLKKVLDLNFYKHSRQALSKPPAGKHSGDTELESLITTQIKSTKKKKKNLLGA
jgi:hypothetical protein